MEVEKIPENVLLVELPIREPQIANRLKVVNETICEKNDCDIIIDFSKVEVINSSNISNLLILREMLENSGQRLILCSVSTITKCIFVVAGLAEIFNFVDDIPSALEAACSVN